MPRLVLEPGNPHDFDTRELESLAEDLRSADPSLEIEVRMRPERGYGVTFIEVLNVVLDTAEAVSAVGGAYAFFDVVVDWAKDRWRREREEGPDSEPRPRGVTLYDHRGEPIKSIRVDAPDASVFEEEDKPPSGTAPHETPNS